MHRQRWTVRADESFLKLLVPRGGAVWKLNRPRQIRQASVTAAVKQAARASKKTSQRNAGRKNICSFPERQFFPADVNHCGNCRADESAVINQSAVLDHENFRERLACKFLAPISCDISNPRADDSADHEP